MLHECNRMFDFKTESFVNFQIALLFSNRMLKLIAGLSIGQGGAMHGQKVI